MLDEVLNADLLQRMCKVDEGFLSRVVERFLRDKSPEVRDALYHPPHDAVPGATSPSLALLLCVDLLFDSTSQPIYLLSAKARLFLEGPPPEPLPMDIATEVAPRPPYLLAPEPDVTEGEGACPTSDCESSASSVAEDALPNFFRMFRDVAHWNEYVRTMAACVHEIFLYELRRTDLPIDRVIRGYFDVPNFCFFFPSYLSLMHALQERMPPHRSSCNASRRELLASTGDSCDAWESLLSTMRMGLSRSS